VEPKGKLKDLKLLAISKQAQSMLNTQVTKEAVYNPGESEAGIVSMEMLRGRVMIVNNE
jgi:hypothetical protein